MQRDLDALEQQFDVAVVGGGIYGACIARLGALHGLKVALIERDDFGAATSRNSAKLVHGGVRYVQHLDLPRIRESAEAQRAWRIAAPHLVRPMRFVIPTYGMGTRGPFALAAGMALYELATWERNRGVQPQLLLPRAGVMGRGALLAQLPMLERHDVTGGAYWFDAQMLDATRLTFECIAQACRRGAVAVNHVEAVRLLVGARGVEGVAVRDRIDGRELEVHAHVTVNATGPWLDGLLATGPKALRKRPPLPLARNFNLVTRRVFAGDDAIGVASRRASDAAIGRSRRLFFVSPWQDCSIIGTWHERYRGDPAAVALTREELAACIAEINEALPAAALSIEDVRSVHLGITPGTDEEEPRAKRAHFVDHRAIDGLSGLLSIAGVKYTTAPTAAQAIVARLCRDLRRGRPVQPRFAQPLSGAAPSGDALAAEAEGIDVSDPAVRWVGAVYGSQRAALLGMLAARGLAPEEHAFRCRVLYGLKNEMVVKLTDAIFRATDHAERGELTAARLGWTADLLALRLGWTGSRRRAEIEEVTSRLARMHTSVAPAGESDVPECRTNLMGQHA